MVIDVASTISIRCMLRSIFLHKSDHYPYITSFHKIWHKKFKLNAKLERILLSRYSPQVWLPSWIFSCFENAHCHGDHVMVYDVKHCSCFLQNWHTGGLITNRFCLLLKCIYNLRHGSSTMFEKEVSNASKLSDRKEGSLFRHILSIFQLANCGIKLTN